MSKVEDELERIRRVRREDRLVNLAATVLVLAVVALYVGVSCAWASVTYGDWHCGLPGVQCRKEIP